MHHFFILESPLQVGLTVDITSIAHQLHSVLRLAPGQHIRLLDGSGHAFKTEITYLDSSKAQGTILERVLLTSEPWTHLTLYQCSLKGDKFEWILQKGTELGISRFVPVISERSVVRPASALTKKFPRWQKIIQEAAEQSGRGRIPELSDVLSMEEAIARGSGLKIVPWEGIVGTTAPNIKSILKPQNQSGQVALLIGPEGGLSRQEAEHAQDHSWQIASLGPRILRAETAAIATVAIVMNAHG